MFNLLEKINQRPEPFQFYTAEELWTDPHTSEQMLTYHLNENLDVSSRNAGFIDKSVQWMVDQFDIRSGYQIADFGCGPGLYSLRLAKESARVTGIDFSKRSITYAQKKAEEAHLEIQYINQNYLTFETDQRFDLIIMIMCDFCALSPAQRQGLLKKFSRFLKPDGRILLDVYSLAAFEKKEEIAIYEKNQLNSFWSPENYYGFVSTFKYDAEKLSLDKYTIVEENRTRQVYNWLQHFSPEDLEEEFTAAGFAVSDLYGDVAGGAYKETADEFAVAAKKIVQKL